MQASGPFVASLYSYDFMLAKSLFQNICQLGMRRCQKTGCIRFKDGLRVSKFLNHLTLHVFTFLGFHGSR